MKNTRLQISRLLKLCELHLTNLVIYSSYKNLWETEIRYENFR